MRLMANGARNGSQSKAAARPNVHFTRFPQMVHPQFPFFPRKLVNS